LNATVTGAAATVVSGTPLTATASGWTVSSGTGVAVGTYTITARDGNNLSATGILTVTCPTGKVANASGNLCVVAPPTCMQYQVLDTARLTNALICGMDCL
jgi:hypothetical protein